MQFDNVTGNLQDPLCCRIQKDGMQQMPLLAAADLAAEALPSSTSLQLSVMQKFGGITDGGIVGRNTWALQCQDSESLCRWTQGGHFWHAEVMR